MSAQTASVPVSTGISRTTVLILAVATGAIAANLYYAQPLLAVMGGALHMSAGALGGLVTITQVGFGLGLVFILPAADKFDRRTLLTLLLVLDAVGLAALAAAPNAGVAVPALFVIGTCNIAAQLIVPAAANLADNASRGRVVGTVITGLLVGILLARTASGVLAAATNWRVVYVAAAVLMLIVALVLRRVLPHQPGTNQQTYPAILRSNVTLFRAHPMLRTRAWFGAIGFAAFSAFWSTVGLHLAATPFRLDPAAIGLIGLLGAAGALAANLTGRLRNPNRTGATLTALALTAAAFVLMWAGTPLLAAVLTGVVVLDVGVQMLHVLSQRLVYEIDPAARNRLNSVYMTFYFVGGAIGSGAATLAWDSFGWAGVCALGVLLAVLGGVVLVSSRVGARRRTALE